MPLNCLTLLTVGHMSFECNDCNSQQIQTSVLMPILINQCCSGNASQMAKMPQTGLRALLRLYRVQLKHWAADKAARQASRLTGVLIEDGTRAEVLSQQEGEFNNAC